MDRQAFKQRMQNLKSYRENNPGKGYWDWKVEAFAEERFNKTGVGAEPNEFDLWVNTGMYRDPMQLANHEMNHYTDYIII